jgi:hypothetical protein
MKRTHMPADDRHKLDGKYTSIETIPVWTCDGRRRSVISTYTDSGSDEIEGVIHDGITVTLTSAEAICELIELLTEIRDGGYVHPLPPT